MGDLASTEGVGRRRATSSEIWGAQVFGLVLLAALGVFVASHESRLSPPTADDLRLVPLKSADAAVTLLIPVPSIGGTISSIARGRGRIRFSVSCAGIPDLRGEIALPRGEAFQAHELTNLPPGCVTGTGRLDLRLSGRGLAVDGIEIADDAGGLRWIEAEAGSGTFLRVIDDGASAGIAASTSTARIPPVIDQRFRADRDGLRGLLVRHLPIRREWLGQIDTELRELGAAEPLYAGRMAQRRFDGDAYRLAFPPVRDSAGKLYELTLRPPGRIVLPLRGSTGEGHVSVDGVAYAEALPLVPLYRTTASAIGWAAFPVVILSVIAGFRSESASRWAFATLVPAAAAISFAYWQRDYLLESRFEFQPDGYDTMALLVRDLLCEPRRQTWDLLWRYLSRFPHAHSPLVPMIAGGLAALGLEITGAFLVVALVASVAGAWAVRAALKAATGSWCVAWAGVSLYATHFLFLRSAIRTCTDAAGLGLGTIALTLAVVAATSRRNSSARIAGIIGASTAGAFARLSSLPVAPAVGAAWLWKSWGNARDDRPSSGRIAVCILIAVVPPAVFFATIYILGLGDSFLLAREKLAFFAPSRTPFRGLSCLVVLLQMTPFAFLLPAPLGVDSDALRVTVTFGVVMMIAVVAMVVATGAPFFARHLLPALPGLAIATAPYLAGSTRGHVILVGTAVLNLALVAVNLWSAAGIGPPHLIH